MPQQWTLTLHPADPPRPTGEDTDGTGTITPVHLHGFAVSILETPDTDHTAHAKPFALSPLLPCPRAQSPGAMQLHLAWLDDSRRPDLHPLTGTQIRLGARRYTLHTLDARSAPYADLARTPPARRVTLRFASPTFFNRNGRWIPLPDPVLTYHGLARRWNAHAPAPLHIPDDRIRELLNAVAVSAHDIATRPVDLGNGTRIGFTGTTTFTLIKTAAPGSDALLAALSRYATHAGVGAHTTHGLGHTRLDTAR